MKSEIEQKANKIIELCEGILFWREQCGMLTSIEARITDTIERINNLAKQIKEDIY